MTSDDGRPPAAAVTQLWQELSAGLRRARTAAGLSLREVERQTDWGRGSLSQIENGKSRPTRAQVEWYDQRLGADGLLVSIYAEARGAHGPTRRNVRGGASISGDDFEMLASLRPNGEMVGANSQVDVGWTLLNSGTEPWRNRQVRRVGASHAERLIRSAAVVPMPDCDPGQQVDLQFRVQIPEVTGTLAAYWEVTDEKGQAFFSASSLIALVLTVRDRVD